MRIRFPFRREVPFEVVYEIFSLLASIIVVHAVYVTLIRPLAAADLEEQAIRIEQDENYIPERSVYVVLRDLEQESCFVLMFWAMAILGYKGKTVIRERMLLHENLIPVDDGTKILYSDARSFERHIRSLPDDVVRCFLPRCLLAALHRFESSRSISDAAATVQSLCQAEGERLDSELSMIRYIVWAIPSIGFIGTVRGIGPLSQRVDRGVLEQPQLVGRLRTAGTRERAHGLERLQVGNLPEALQHECGMALREHRGHHSTITTLG